MLASNFIPGGGIITKAAKAVIKGTSKAVKAYKASKAVTKVNKKPKPVPAKSYRSTPKTQSASVSKAVTSTPKPKPKVAVAPKPARGSVTRVEKQAIKKPTEEPAKPLLDVDLQFFASGGKSTGNSIGNGKQYSTLYEASTGNGASRSAHRNAANKEFYNQMASDTQFKNAVDEFFGYDVMGHMKSGKSALKNPSKDWAWHHPADTPGVVRLVPKNQHQSPLLQDILHPGPNGQGGFGLFK
ncbi:hypothetical protein FZC84_21545 [Rossellomorea vietnamensis]|uniref:Uncharacterized protein n=1 Tax=Rossellomorea vietnamensis TaxID=218284 RepID=A0A5D4M1V1_9BACI|nr:hypothetical protein [Rossellomorea vietnamensis]TYR95542.1 hypothetical protein FZC84_21545 [Rossellomorea vietnamensis]